MSSYPQSRLVDTLEHGAILEVTIEDLSFLAYVVVSEPDLERVADFVPQEQFEGDGDVHVAALDDPGQAREQIQDIAFNMNPGDAAVFLCADEACFRGMLEELGQEPDLHPGLPTRLN
ncbi:MAG: hypothetical protein WBA83_10030 [Burkholderiaceae bacterium]